MASHGPHDVPQKSLARSVTIIFACTLAMIVNISNSNIVSIALPRIGEALDIEESQLQWLISAYTLSSGCLLLLFGRLADLWGRKRVFMAGAAFQAVFSLGCGFAKDALTLDILRGFQGVGSAATIPASLGILAHSFPPSPMRSIAFATFAAGAPVGGALGLTLGGVITQKASWRGIFYLSAGLAVLCIISALSFDADPPLPRGDYRHSEDGKEKEISASEDRRVDWLGALLVTAGLVLVIFALSDGPVDGWKTSYVIALLIVGVFLVALFCFWQLHLEKIHESGTIHQKNSRWHPPPILPMSIWTKANGRFAAIQVIALLTWMAFLSWTFWIQLYYQDYLQLTPIKTMVRLLPMTVTGICCNFITAMVVGHISIIWLLLIGTIGTSLAPLLLASMHQHEVYWAYGFPASIVAVFGADFVFASGTLFVAKSVAPNQQSVAGGLFQTMTQIGTSLGLTITTIVFNSKAGPNGSGQSNTAFEAYKSAQWTAFAFGMVAAAVAAATMHGVGVVGERKGPQRAQDEEKTSTTQEEQTVS